MVTLQSPHTKEPSVLARTSYLSGVPCWVDLIQPDPDATMAFYSGLFDWTFQVRTPEGAPVRYAYALLDGLVVGGVGGPPQGDADPAGWTNYVAVTSADEAAAAVEANGGRVLSPPTDIPRAGRVALCADPEGAVFGLWQGGENKGAQQANAPGSWNFSELHTADPGRAERFYGAVFGWELDPFELTPGAKFGLWRLPGYGDFLAESDPEIRERQAASQAPPGFADAVAFLETDGTEVDPRWSITFSVADADAAVARALALGATQVSPLIDTEYTRMGAVVDPQGAVLTLSQYRPPQPG
jgi:predicted enzyme related to lactoylglutathione lyase